MIGLRQGTGHMIVIGQPTNLDMEAYLGQKSYYLAQSN